MATENCNSDYEPLNKQRRIRSSLISKLGDDLLLEVLIRLPNPRYACRSKSVCKWWRSLISDPGFNRRFVSHHQSISEQQPPLLLPSDDPQSIIGSFVPTPPGLRLVALDSCGDLILCGFPLREEHITTICRMYIICNPFTKQWMPLPLEPLWPDGTSELAARLVCEPSISSNLDLGDGQVHVYSEYRFRVVCLYNHRKALKLDVFCSESGEWTKEALVLEGHLKLHCRNVVSCNGELFWSYLETQEVEAGRFNPRLAVLNPFRLDMPPAYDASPLHDDANPWWDISVSQGALHAFVFEEKPTPGCSRIASKVWRMERGGQSWRKVCEGVLKSSNCNHPLVWTRGEDDEDWMKQCEGMLKTSGANHNLDVKDAPFLAALENTGLFRTSSDGAILSCNLRRGDLELYSKLRVYAPRWACFHSRVSCWPTPMPRYEEFS
ncbi:unnamed protein product [Linum trigynum]|uniref:F-box protein At3g26010-like beta-propeller domain-containing protein n=1 Tax=Linum trigynum TaxID=586398 RepID=A0AAV2D5L4_9ROSI